MLGLGFEALVGEGREVLTSRDLRGEVGGDIFWFGLGGREYGVERWFDAIGALNFSRRYRNYFERDTLQGGK